MTKILLSMDSAKIIFVYSLLVIILFAFIKLIFTNKNDNKDLQKIIGGLSVFVVAIFANSFAVYFLSLLIGGLIIASEEFIKFIFAVWKSSPTEVNRVVQLFTLATPEEIKEKKDEEIKIESKLGRPEEVEIIKDKYISAENQIHDFFKEKYGNLYVREIKIENEYGSKIFDGAIISKTQASEIFHEDQLKGRNDLGLQSAVEIKFFSDTQSVHTVIQKLIAHSCFLNFIILYKIVVIIENLNKEDADKIFSELSKLYSNRHQFEFYIFSFTENKIKLFRSSNPV